MQKKVGLGEDDFKLFRKKDLYYVDKSMYIKEFVDNADKVVLVTRPRRFGKSLNMSMLDYFFDINKNDSVSLFDGLKIMEAGEEYTSLMNKYPCISLSLANVRETSYNDMILSMKSLMLEVYTEHRCLLESDKIYDNEKSMINEILNIQENEVTLKQSLKTLTRYLYTHFDMPVMLFLDEYDVPLQNAYVHGYYNEAIEFFKAFYGTSFKGNKYLEKAVLTGVSRIAKESLFSGLNNFKNCTIMDNNFATCFGITNEEIDKVLLYFDIKEEKQEIQKWYDGYKIGDNDNIYNPWSVFNFLQKREIIPYWVNTSSNDLIKLILKDSFTIKEKIERLLKDEEIEVQIDFETIIQDIEKNEDNIWGLLVSTGYLKVTNTLDKIRDIYKVKIVNYEIKSLFESIILEWFSNKVIANNLRDILNDLVTLNLSDYSKKFQVLVKEMMSFMDVGDNTAENFYHAFVLRNDNRT